MTPHRSHLDAALYQLHAALPLWRNEIESDADLRRHYDELLASRGWC